MQAAMADAVSPFRQQIAELKEFSVIYQEIFVKLKSELKGQQKEIYSLQKQLLDLRSRGV